MTHMQRTKILDPPPPPSVRRGTLQHTAYPSKASQAKTVYTVQLSSKLPAVLKKAWIKKADLALKSRTLFREAKMNSGDEEAAKLESFVSDCQERFVLLKFALTLKCHKKEGMKSSFFSVKLLG